MILRRILGPRTTWYLHSQMVCDKLYLIPCSFLNQRSQKHSSRYLRKGAFIFKYCGIAFSTLLSIAGSLVLELKNHPVMQWDSIYAAEERKSCSKKDRMALNFFQAFLEEGRMALIPPSYMRYYLGHED